jgi:hypothetical protein
MTQEVQITITMEMCITLQKEDIKTLIQSRLEENGLMKVDSIKEEEVIYL